MKLISISFALTLISIPSPASASVIPRDDEGDINLWPILHPIEDILHRAMLPGTKSVISHKSSPATTTTTILMFDQYLEFSRIS
ncbi:hypothetical protein FRC03_006777 [Tulasnella sp. 419]|nr:hypothetical protein FRC03_006777 [Tulasnella sp. 419]